MTCGYSKETLALYVEGDLATPQAFEPVKQHVNACAACQEYCNQLQSTQSLIKSRFRSSCREAVSSETLASVRRSVMARIESSEESLGWAVRLERMLMLGFRKQRVAFAGFAIVAIVSASLLGQMQYSRPQAGTSAAVFAGKNALVRPDGYRDWVFAGKSEEGLNVYIDPAAYRQYANSGKFPEGAVLVRERSQALEVSVKDSTRFQDGWGYFSFSEGSEPAAPNTGCVSCHRDKAVTDSVFTQFYPVLRSIRS